MSYVTFSSFADLWGSIDTVLRYNLFEVLKNKG
jgi:hypothetical protein